MIGSLKYRILNLILFAVVLSIAFINYETWSHSDDSNQYVPQKPEAGLEKPSETEDWAAKEESKSVQPVQSFNIIAEKNIFNPERKDFPPPDRSSTDRPKPVARPQVTLSGVMISDDYQCASISTGGGHIKRGEKETMALKLGDKVGDYRLAKIAADSITLEAPGDSFTVPLYGPKKTQARAEKNTGIQPTSEAKASQPAQATSPAVEIVKAEAMKSPGEMLKEGATSPPSPWARKDSLFSAVKRGMAMRQSLMGSGQQNAAIIESTAGNRGRSPVFQKTESQ